MAQELIIGADDERMDESQLSPRAQDLLHDYRLVQYDLSVGHRYTQDEMFYPDEPIAQAAGAPSGPGQ